MIDKLPQEMSECLMVLDNSIPTTEAGKFWLEDIKWDYSGDSELAVTVVVVDENNIPMHSVPVGFFFDTGTPMPVHNLNWNTGLLPKGTMDTTYGGVPAQLILGADGVIKKGEPGGVSVAVMHPDFSSVVLKGAGMKADHTGMIITFKLQRAGVQSYEERITQLEAQVAELAQLLVG